MKQEKISENTKEIKKQNQKLEQNLVKENKKNISLKHKIRKIFYIFVAVVFVSGIFALYVLLKLAGTTGSLVNEKILQEKHKISVYYQNKTESIKNWFDNLPLVGKKKKSKISENLQNQVNESYKYKYETGKYSPDQEPIVNVVKKVLPSVVSIAVEADSLQPGPTFVQQQAKIGSGFIIDSSGIIVTNKHVVEAMQNVTYKVITYDGKQLNVVKILEDPVNDIAFVFVNGKDMHLKPLALGDSNLLELGQTVIAIGTPFGEFPSTVTSGIISGLHRKVDAPSQWGYSNKFYSDVIQTDAAINPGNSGGPLINLAGQAIGINFAKINGGDNISFALPINIVKQRLEQYKKYGHFMQAFLGVGVKEIDKAMAAYYKIPAGALVVRVLPDSPAYEAGIKAKDIITQVDGMQVAKYGLISILSRHNVGDVVKITIKRPVWSPIDQEYRFKTIEKTIKLADRYKFTQK